jgi:hypothetical protein
MILFGLRLPRFLRRRRVATEYATFHTLYFFIDYSLSKFGGSQVIHILYPHLLTAISWHEASISK